MIDMLGRAISKRSPERAASYFPTLAACMFMSLLLVFITRTLAANARGTTPIVLSGLAGIAPLVYYHMGYLYPRAKGLSQAAVDSVYYYGFLVTIFALGTSALSMVGENGGMLFANPGSVITQFGVGLCATGYAIFARLHLSSQTGELGDSSPDAVIDHYVSRSRELIEQLDLTLHSFGELAQKSEVAVQSIEKVSKESIQINSAALKVLAEAFKSELDQIFGRTKESLSEIRGMVSDVSFVEERKLFARNIKAIAENTSRLNEEMQNLTKVCQESAAATQNFSLENKSLSESVGKIAVQFSAASKGAQALATELEHAEKKISASTDELKRQIGESSRTMADDVQRASAASSLLASKIVEIAETVIERTKKN